MREQKLLSTLCPHAFATGGCEPLLTPVLATQMPLVRIRDPRASSENFAAEETMFTQEMGAAIATLAHTGQQQQSAPRSTDNGCVSELRRS